MILEGTLSDCTHSDDGASVVVGEVEAFADLSSTDCEEEDSGDETRLTHLS